MHHLLVLLHHLPYKDQKKHLQVGNAKIAQLTSDLFPFNPQHPFVQTQATVDRKKGACVCLKPIALPEAEKEQLGSSHRTWELMWAFI